MSNLDQTAATTTSSAFGADHAGAIDLVRADLERVRVELVRQFALHPSWIALCLLDPQVRDARSDGTQHVLAENADGGRAALLAELVRIPAFVAFQHVGHALATLRAATVCAADEGAVSHVRSTFRVRHADALTPPIPDMVERSPVPRSLAAQSKALDAEFSHVIARIRAFSPAAGSRTVEQDRPRLSFRPPAGRGSDGETPPCAASSEAPTQPHRALIVSAPQAARVAEKVSVGDLQVRNVAPLPVHAAAAQRLDALERELELLAERPSGALSPMREAPLANDAARPATAKVSASAQMRGDQSVSGVPIALCDDATSTPGNTQSSTAQSGATGAQMTEPARTMLSRVVPHVREAASHPMIKIPTLAGALPILEADIEIVRAAPSAARSRSMLLPAPSASAAPLLSGGAYEEASVDVVVSR